MQLPRLARIGCALFLAITGISCFAQSAATPYDAVDPRIGTDADGNTFPGATLPFGMVQWSPDTSNEAWYRYKDLKIDGFGMVHISGAGCPVYGDFAVLPTAAELTSSPGKKLSVYAAGFDHSTEVIHPGYYAVTLAGGIRVELTTTERAGIARFIFPAGEPARVFVNAGSSANLPESYDKARPEQKEFADSIEIKGGDGYSGAVTAGSFCDTDSKYRLYVAGRFNKPYKSTAVWQDDAVMRDGKRAQGLRTGAWLDFGSEHEVLLKVGVSFVSEAGAHANLDKEIPGWKFDTVHESARKMWTQLLDRVQVEGGTPEQRTIFYTGVYHSLLSPNLFSDDDGSYMGFDWKSHSLRGAKQNAQYANFSDWDIYRNTVQFQALLDAERSSDQMQSLVNDADQSGWLPRWPAANDVTYVMGGDSPAAEIASSYAFGARGFDVKTALKQMVKAGTVPGPAPHNNAERPFLGEYRKLGYVPTEKDRISASRTLEYASDDFAVAQMAKGLGDEPDYKQFLNQSENWKNLLDPETRWIRPRASDGTWLAGFDADRSLPKRPNAPADSDQDGFEEGNTYQYTFMIPFDYPALFAAIGGDGSVKPRLDKFFLKLRCWNEPCFNMENEPDFVTPYAYVFAGMPWKTQEVVSRIAAETFTTAPNGLPGNDDLGATSGVYVWNALGMYPAVPGVGGMVLGAPMFEKATLRLAGARTLEIRRTGSGIYVQTVTLDGAEYASSWLPLEKIHAGTTRLEFTMGTEPNKARGSAVADRPPAFR